MNSPSIGVVGAGVMGRGVALDLAQHGLNVVLLDRTQEILAAAREDIERQARLQGLFRPATSKDALSRIRFTPEMEHLGETRFVIENVTEKWEIKREVYLRLDEVVPPPCILAANTSAISIAKIASATRRPDRVLGMHFMNPVPLKSVVEVVRGPRTSDETLAAAHELLGRIGKQGIVVRDSPGFVSNRVLMLAVNEAIDRLFRSCFGHKMGPLETADLIGLDTVLLSLEVLEEEFGPRYRPRPLLRKLVEEGRWGQKSGRGFYPDTTEGQT